MRICPPAHTTTTPPPPPIFLSHLPFRQLRFHRRRFPSDKKNSPRTSMSTTLTQPRSPLRRRGSSNRYAMTSYVNAFLLKRDVARAGRSGDITGRERSRDTSRITRGTLSRDAGVVSHEVSGHVTRVVLDEIRRHVTGVVSHEVLCRVTRESYYTRSRDEIGSCIARGTRSRDAGVVLYEVT